MSLWRSATLVLAVCVAIPVSALNADGSQNSDGTQNQLVTDPGNAAAGVDVSAGDAPSESGLFLGAHSSRIVIELPPNRGGITPAVQLRYQSRSGNGFVGMGWMVELGSIDRNSRRGIRYASDDYVFRTAAGSTDLVDVGGEYRERFRSEYRKIEKRTESGQTYWLVTDRFGVKYRYGSDSRSRQDDPGDTRKVYRWCLDQVRDANGNGYDITYFKDRGAIYPETISYNGITVRFWRDGGRADMEPRYDLLFGTVMAYRLGVIEIQAPSGRGGSKLVRAYALTYRQSPATNRSLLTSVTQYGSDAQLTTGSTQGTATVTGGTALPATSYEYSETAWQGNESAWELQSALDPACSSTIVDLDGDGRPDRLGGLGSTCINSLSSGWQFGDDYAVPEEVRAHWQGLRIVDVSGDGLPDLLQSYFDADSNTTVSRAWLNAGHCSTGASCAWIPNAGFAPPTPFLGMDPDKTVFDRAVMFIDVDGDGRVDLLQGWYDHGATVSNAWVNTGSGWDRAPEYAPPIAFFGRDRFTATGLGFDYGTRLVDLDGDRRPDLIHSRRDWGESFVRAWKNVGRDCARPGCAWDEAPEYTRVPGDALLTPFIIRDDDRPGGFDYGVRLADVNGDGLIDLLWSHEFQWSLQRTALLNTGSGWVRANEYAPPAPFTGCLANGSYASASTSYFGQGLRIADLNGDGAPDLIVGINGETGSPTMPSRHEAWLNRATACAGTGCKWTTAARYAPPASFELWGESFPPFSAKCQSRLDCYYYWSAPTGVAPEDVSLDGLADIRAGATSWRNKTTAPDLLIKESNGIGGNKLVSYKPSTSYPNTLMGPVLQNVASVTLWDDRLYDPLTRVLDYAGGYFHPTVREFRGYNYVAVWELGSEDRTRAPRETRYWFHQGDSGDAEVNDPWALVGRAKGLLYRREEANQPRQWADNGESYRLTLMTYWVTEAGPSYFTPVRSASTAWCGYAPHSADFTCGRWTTTDYADFDLSGSLVPAYDSWGNRLRENHYYFDSQGGVYPWSRTVVRTFAGNGATGIVALPASETVYSGAGPSAVAPQQMVARTSFFYDGTLDERTCVSAGADPAPQRGNLTRAIKWLKGGVDPEEWRGHDAHGNMVCAVDPDGNRTSYRYDGAWNTFRVLEMNAKGHTKTTSYYGVDGAADLGLYGQVRSVTEPNGATVNFEYDAFGRNSVESHPPVPSPAAGDPYPGLTVSRSYALGDAYGNHVDVTTSTGESSEDRFDGFGRTYFSTRKMSSQPGARTFAVATWWDPAGRKTAVSQPYDGNLALPEPRYTLYAYDWLGRVTSETSPDGRVSSRCYGDLYGWTVTVDPNGHRTLTEADQRGNVLSVQKDVGTHSTCDPYDPGNGYARSVYSYDALGRMTSAGYADSPVVTDFDTLGRKIHVSDANMGSWQYGYTAAGDLLWQRDANSFAPDGAGATYFEYDALHRITARYRHAPGSVGAVPPDDEVYEYDNPTVPYSVGRLTRVLDASGATQYGYDVAGRKYLEKRTIDGKTYTSRIGYDGAGRVEVETYPVVEPSGSMSAAKYDYNADGFLAKVSVDGVTFASFPRYNLLGQVGEIRFGNGVTTAFGYWDAGNNRVHTIDTTGPSGGLLALTYGYDNVGNVLTVQDRVSPSNSQAYGYDEFDRLISAAASGAVIPGASLLVLDHDPIRLHQVTKSSDGRSFQYDANGNMKTDGVRTFTWDYANRLASASGPGAVATFTYDVAGRRAKRTITRAGVRADTIYLGRLEECSASGCVRHVFAGNRRIAFIATDGSVRYFHGDHLGSTRVVTDASGLPVDRMKYDPYGAESATSGTRYRYTSQELDSEVGLYQLGARYYDPVLSQFVSADSVVPNLLDPFSFNRYRYASNNPLRFVDPSGHAGCDPDQTGGDCWEDPISTGAEPQPTGAEPQLTGAEPQLTGGVESSGTPGVTTYPVSGSSGGPASWSPAEDISLNAGAAGVAVSGGELLAEYLKLRHASGFTFLGGATFLLGTGADFWAAAAPQSKMTFGHATLNAGAGAGAIWLGVAVNPVAGAIVGAVYFAVDSKYEGGVPGLYRDSVQNVERGLDEAFLQANYGIRNAYGLWGR